MEKNCQTVAKTIRERSVRSRRPNWRLVPNLDEHEERPKGAPFRSNSIPSIKAAYRRIAWQVICGSCKPDDRLSLVSGEERTIDSVIRIPVWP